MSSDLRWRKREPSAWLDPVHRRHFNTNKRASARGANLIKTNEFVSIRYNLFLSLANLLFELCEIKMDDQYEMSLARHLRVWTTEFIYRFSFQLFIFRSTTDRIGGEIFHMKTEDGVEPTVYSWRRTKAGNKDMNNKKEFLVIVGT